MSQDQSRAPIFKAIEAYCDARALPFTTPGQKEGRDNDPHNAEVLGVSAFRSPAAWTTLTCPEAWWSRHSSWRQRYRALRSRTRATHHSSKRG